MSFELAKSYLEKKGFVDNIIHFDTSTATVALAANALGVVPGQIAKSLAFKNKDDNAFLVVMAGDTVVDNKKFKDCFNIKSKMLKFEEVEEKVGHAVGGVCPFGIKQGVNVYLDESIKRFDVIYPACGDSNSVLKLSTEQLYDLSNAKAWVDVAKIRI